jgi:hypothetical protein
MVKSVTLKSFLQMLKTATKLSGCGSLVKIHIIIPLIGLLLDVRCLSQIIFKSAPLLRIISLTYYSDDYSLYCLFDLIILIVAMFTIVALYLKFRRLFVIINFVYFNRIICSYYVSFRSWQFFLLFILSLFCILIKRINHLQA